MNGRKEFLLIMKINKNVIKKAGVGLFSLTLGLGALGGGYYFSQHSVSGVSAEQDNTEVNKSTMVTTEALTELNVLRKLTDELLAFETNKVALSQETLDSYLYYLVQYQLGQYEFYSVDMETTMTFEDGLAILEKLYAESNIEPGFYWKLNDQGEKESISLTRSIKKPVNYNDVKTEVEEKVEAKLDDIKSNDSVTASDVVVETPDLVVDNP